MWKMQLLDEDTLLLKFSSEDVVTLRSQEPNSQHCLFVIYHIGTTEILAVFENTTEPIVDFFENFADYFRNNNLTLDARYSSSSSNNIFAR
jgi:de-etiolated-1